jgi:GntR family transcriptional regulator, vanillate catabolism transcriptional regulator
MQNGAAGPTPELATKVPLLQGSDMSKELTGHQLTAPGTESQTLRALLQMREMLIKGEFKPGERIREVPLSARLSVSRTPLRLVLDRLANEGLLEAWPKGGFAARAFTVQDIMDAIEIRGVLEGTAARLAAERLQSETELQIMWEINGSTDRLLERSVGDVDGLAEYIELNARFHAELVALAKSPMLGWSLQRVLALPFASPNAFIFPQAEWSERRSVLLISNLHHQAIADAIAHREGTRAESVTREHSRMGRQSIELALKEERTQQIPGGSLLRRIR